MNILFQIQAYKCCYINICKGYALKNTEKDDIIDESDKRIL